MLHNCFIDNEKYDLVITPHRQSVGYIRTKRQTLSKKIFNKQKQFIRKRFSKRRKAGSESETAAIQELHNLKESIVKTHQIDEQIFFSDSETTSQASIKSKCKIKKTLHKQAIRLYKWNQPIRHIEKYTLTVIQHKNDSK